MGFTSKQISNAWKRAQRLEAKLKLMKEEHSKEEDKLAERIYRIYVKYSSDSEFYKGK